jgi:hypothetical protein
LLRILSGLIEWDEFLFSVITTKFSGTGVQCVLSFRAVLK